MVRRSIITITLAVTACLATTAASAETLTITPARTVATAARTLTFNPGPTQIGCTISLSATLTTTPILVLPNTARVGVGSVNDGLGTNCGFGNSLSLDLGPDWGVSAQLVAGAVRLTFNSISFLVSLFGGLAKCLYQGTITGTLNAAGNLITFPAGTSVPLSAQLRLILVQCPNPGSLEGTIGLSPAIAFTLR